MKDVSQGRKRKKVYVILFSVILGLFSFYLLNLALEYVFVYSVIFFYPDGFSGESFRDVIDILSITSAVFGIYLGRWYYLKKKSEGVILEQEKRPSTIFGRYLKLLYILIAIALLFFGVRLIYSQALYHEWNATTEECAGLVGAVIVDEYKPSLNDEVWWEETCNSENGSSKIAIQYSIYEKSLDDTKPYWFALCFLVILLTVSLVGKWVYKGSSRG